MINCKPIKHNLSLIAFLAVALIVSCSKDTDELSLKNQDKISVDRIVTIEQARAFSNTVSNILFTTEDDSPQLKSTTGDKHRTVKNVIPIKKDDITVLYAVNFENDLGYVLLSADNHSFPVVSMADEGSFKVNDIDPQSPVSAWMEDKKNQILQKLTEAVDTTNDNFNLWTNIVPNDSVEIEISYNLPPDTPQLKGRRQHSTGKASIYPMIGQRLKWGQRYGANADLKSPYVGYLVGCPAVATGMIFYKHWHPSQYGYMYMPYTFTSNTSTAASKMLSGLAHDYHDNYHTSANPYFQNINWSGTLPVNILDYLKKNGYQNAKLGNYNFETVYNNIKMNGAVLLAGYDASGGHIWYSDGYYEQSWKVTQKKKFLGITTSTKTWTEYADFLYMNWGWDNGKAGSTYQGGVYNGWYDASNHEAAPNSGNPNIGFTHNMLMYTDLYPTYN